jgi:pimeloyl-ACP methyl ester carboxylesterase
MNPVGFMKDGSRKKENFNKRVTIPTMGKSGQPYVISLLVLFLIIGFFLVIIYGLLYGVLFYPLQEHIWTPTIPHRNLMINGNISAWHFDNFPNHKTVLFCHGNAGNISHRDYVIEMCYRQKLNLLLFDYRGFGKSKGIPSQQNVCQDGETAYRYLRGLLSSDSLQKKLSPDDIIIWGESLGGAVATYIASKNPCAALILMCTFSSIDDIIKDQQTSLILRVMSSVLPWVTNIMSSKSLIKDVKCPIVVVHSKTDEVIPYSNAKRLYESIPHKCKRFITIAGGHSTPVISQKELEEMFRFCCLDTTECSCTKDILSNLQRKRDPVTLIPIDDNLDDIHTTTKNINQKGNDNNKTSDMTTTEDITFKDEFDEQSTTSEYSTGFIIPLITRKSKN